MADDAALGTGWAIKRLKDRSGNKARKSKNTFTGCDRRKARRQLLGDILPIVLARLGVVGVQSNPSGEVASLPPEPDDEPRTPSNR